MSKRIITKEIVNAFLIMMLALILVPSTQSATIRVPDDFGDISSAIESANSGDLITVASGTYKEALEINKSISLQGSEKTILMGLISIQNTENVSIDGFSIDGENRKDAHFGIWCSNSSVKVSNNLITGFHHGIGSEQSKMIIENNIVNDSFNVGIQIGSAISVELKNNTVKENGIGILISLSHKDIIISGNVISDNRTGIECSDSAPKIRNNLIEKNQIGIQSANENKPDIGTDGDPGFNVIKDNGINIVNLDRRNDVQAKHNYWGDSKGPDISRFDGGIDYIPWLEFDPSKNQPIKHQDKLSTTWAKIKIGG